MFGSTVECPLCNKKIAKSELLFVETKIKTKIKCCPNCVKYLSIVRFIDTRDEKTTIKNPIQQYQQEEIKVEKQIVKIEKPVSETKEEIKRDNREKEPHIDKKPDLEKTEEPILKSNAVNTKEQISTKESEVDNSKDLLKENKEEHIIDHKSKTNNQIEEAEKSISKIDQEQKSEKKSDVEPQSKTIDELNSEKKQQNDNLLTKLVEDAKEQKPIEDIEQKNKEKKEHKKEQIKPEDEIISEDKIINKDVEIEIKHDEPITPDLKEDIADEKEDEKFELNAIDMLVYSQIKSTGEEDINKIAKKLNENEEDVENSFKKLRRNNLISDEVKIKEIEKAELKKPKKTSKPEIQKNEKIKDKDWLVTSKEVETTLSRTLGKKEKERKRKKKWKIKIKRKKN